MNRPVSLPLPTYENGLAEKALSLALTVLVMGCVYSALAQIWPWLLGALEQFGAGAWVASLVALDVGLLLSLNGLLWVAYRSEHPLLARHKVLARPWPWQENPELWAATLRRTVLGLALNIVVMALATALDIWANGLPFAFAVEAFPTVAGSFWQLVFFVVVEDLAFYFAHSLLHRPCFYWIHKQHHEYFHTIGLAAAYSHPLEFVLANLLPFSLGAKLLGARVHAATYMCWAVLKLMETTEAHCGYDFGVGVLRFLPFSGSSDFHNFHHSHNVGNYGVLTLWDKVFGTSIDYELYKQKQH